MNIYKQGTRDGVKFESRKGIVAIEDLWSIKLDDLNAMAKEVNRKLKSFTSEESFIPNDVSRTTKEEVLLKLQLEILKDVIITKSEEMRLAEIDSKRRSDILRLRTLIADKERTAEQEAPIEELLKALEVLEKGEQS